MQMDTPKETNQEMKTKKYAFSLASDVDTFYNVE